MNKTSLWSKILMVECKLLRKITLQKRNIEFFCKRRNLIQRIDLIYLVFTYPWKFLVIFRWFCCIYCVFVPFLSLLNIFSIVNTFALQFVIHGCWVDGKLSSFCFQPLYETNGLSYNIYDPHLSRYASFSTSQRWRICDLRKNRERKYRPEH